MASNPPAATVVATPAIAVPAAQVLTAAQAHLTNVDAAVSLAANRTQEAVVQAAQKNLPSKLLPEYFTGNGTQDVDDWMKSFDRYKKMHEWTDKKAMSIFTISLQGRALRWLNSLTDIDLDDPSQWSRLVSTFTEYFGTNPIKLRAQLATCRQGAREPTKIYSERFLALIGQTSSRMSEAEKADFFIFGLQPNLRKNIIRFNPKSIKDALELCECDEVADAFDELDMSGGSSIEMNAVSVTSTSRTVPSRPAKEDSLDKRIDSKLDVVVNMLGENTSSINKLTGFLQQTLTAAANNSRPHLGQAYTEVSLPALYGVGRNQSYYSGNGHDQQRRGRSGMFCEFCQRTVTTHTTDNCFKNPEYQAQQRSSQHQLNVPQQQQQLSSQQMNNNNNNNNNTARTNALSNQDARQQPTAIQAANTNLANRQSAAQNNMRTLSTIDFDDGANHDPSCLAEGAVSGEVVNKMLLDTGAAVSAISYALFQRLPPAIRDQLKDTPLKLRSATNVRMETLGLIILDLQLGSAPPKGNKCEITGLPFIVVRELSAEVILGRDILWKYFDSINLRAQRLCYGDGHYIQLLTEPIVYAREKPVFNITLAKSVSVQPHSNTLVQAGVISDRADLVKEIIQSSTNSVAHMIASPAVVAETDGVVTLDDGLYDVQDITSDNKLLVMFTNTADYAVRLPKGMPLGKLRLTSADAMTVEAAHGDCPPVDPSLNVASIVVEDDVSEHSLDHYLSDEKANSRTNQIDSVNFDVMDINDDEKIELRTLLNTYNDRFAENPSNPSRTTLITHSIDTGDHRPIRVSLKRFSHDDELFIEQKVDEMLQNGIISRSRSPWGFRPAIVLKSDSTKRFCVNYTPLNRLTTFVGEPMPNVDTLLDCIRGACIFSSLDLASGYWQIRMNPADCEKTRFSRNKAYSTSMSCRSA
jgi:hypothetical protein